MIVRLRSLAPHLQSLSLVVVLVAAALLFAVSDGGGQIVDDALLSNHAEAVLGTTAVVHSTIRESLVIGRSWSDGIASSAELDAASEMTRSMVSQLADRVGALIEAIEANDNVNTGEIQARLAALEARAFDVARNLDAREIDQAAEIAETELAPEFDRFAAEVAALRDGRAAHIEAVQEGLGTVATAARFMVALIIPALAVLVIYRTMRIRQQRNYLRTELARERELHRKKDAFLAAASHHINTPLAGVVGFAELLRDRTRSFNAGVRNEIIDVLAMQAREAAHVVDDILVAGRSDFGEMIVIEDEVDLRRIVEDAITGEGSALRSRVTISGNAIARADHKWVTHIVRNLIRNAVSFGGENIVITISGAHRRVLLEVADDGPGLPTDRQDVVFQTYYSYRQVEGLAPSMGLGLSVARTLARAMGGDLVCHREDGQSVFELSLPVGPDAETTSLAPDLTIDPMAGRPTKGAIDKILALGGPVVVYQPVVDLNARSRGEERILGYEALSRFEFASPPEWFEAAQAAGLRLELDLSCIRAAVTGFPSEDFGGFLAINVHDSTLMSSRLMDALDGADPSQIVFELSEAASIKSYEKTREVVDALSGRGIRLAIDDIGSGEIDMWHILRLQPAMIKIDMSLVREIESTPRNRALIRGLATMAKDLGMLVVGEGIEREEELDQLLELGVQYGQGYLLGRPRPLRWIPRVLSGSGS
jgi:EAL domain-containing protein (putative c-di-GMP-specific phosphodiesterase class I)/signal transduction histidine kinase